MKKIVEMKKSKYGKVLILSLLIIYSVWLSKQIVLKDKDLSYLLDQLIQFFLGITNPKVEQRSNLVLFDTIKLYANSSGLLSVNNILANVLGNIFAFVPIGMGLMLLTSRCLSLWKVTLIGFVYSFLLEGTQWILRVGVFDVDDLLLNTLGVFVGGLIIVFIIKKYNYYEKEI